MIPITFLAEWALRSSALILAGTLILWASRVKSPSIRLAAWTAMLFASLALPALKITLPQVRVETIQPSPITTSFQELPAPEATTAPAPQNWPRIAAIAWAAVATTLILRLLTGLTLSLRLLRRSRPTGHEFRESDDLVAPVTLGILRPKVVLPRDWREWPAAKLTAVLAHERSHIQRRDPALQFLSAVHRALLWHSPMIWFLHTGIVRTAEEASDDAALAAALDRPQYAELLLEFMRTGVRGAPNAGVPMARYGRLESRIHRILDGTTLSLGLTRRSIALIAATACPLIYLAAATAPQAPPLPAPMPQPSAQPKPALKQVSAVAQATPRYLRGIGNATPTSTVVIRPRIDGQLLSVDFKEGDIVHAGKLLATMDTATRWQHELAYQEERLSQFRAGHVDAGMIQSVQADVDRAQLELSHAEIRSPIDGITGFLQIGAGNIVHSGEPLVVVTQIQPIAVVFTIPEDTLPRVRAQTARGTSPLAEAWDRANSTRIASGRLIAIDNQIDPQTGTAKLKAVFENKEGALFPNQFVNVRLYLN